MKKILLIIIAVFASVANFAQDNVVEINNTNISTPDVYDFGQIDDVVYCQYVIKNNRNTPVLIKDVVVPSGFFANISDSKIASGKKIILYIGLKPNMTGIDGDFEKNIILKTNLITDITLKVKGTVIKTEENDE